MEKYLEEHENDKDPNQLEKIEEKVEAEENQNKQELALSLGKIIRYGDKISLQHIYSKCYLSFNTDTLAYENGCIEVQTPSYFLDTIC